MSTTKRQHTHSYLKRTKGCIQICLWYQRRMIYAKGKMVRRKLEEKKFTLHKNKLKLNYKITDTEYHLHQLIQS